MWNKLLKGQVRYCRRRFGQGQVYPLFPGVRGQQQRTSDDKGKKYQGSDSVHSAHSELKRGGVSTTILDTVVLLFWILLRVTNKCWNASEKRSKMEMKCKSAETERAFYIHRKYTIKDLDWAQVLEDEDFARY